jgi:16S rRNA A1518/A1519 N6-dimethyltransferase RsmA/KsgA/DIM1 with predicted DNA glycosylase/AP lyase activity
MSTTELKEKLIDKIQHTDDENILAEVNRLLGIESDDVFIFSDAEKIKIKEARLQIKNGDFLTHDEANKEIEEWLGK